jgi:hypothetical protein
MPLLFNDDSEQWSSTGSTALHKRKTLVITGTSNEHSYGTYVRITNFMELGTTREIPSCLGTR